MTPGVWLALGISLLGVYLFVLGWNVLAAALSYMRRARLRRFPLGRCLISSAGPSLLPISLPVALARWGYGSDAVGLSFALSWGLSFWGSGEVERRLPRSQTNGGDSGEVSREAPQSDAPSPLTNAQSCWLMVFGAVKAWLALAIGVAAGYGVGATVSWVADLPFQPPSWARLATRGPISVLVWYGMLGFLVECLRVQGDPGDGLSVTGWSAARELRFRLLACLAGAAICIGLFAGLWW